MRHILAALLLSAPGLAIASQDWSVGVEREVDSGVYAKLVHVENGWRLWRWETSNGVECEAVKSAMGKPHPSPSGAGMAYAGAAPLILVLNNYKGEVEWVFRGHYPGPAASQYREVGDRFYTYHPRDGDLMLLDGKTIDVNVISYRYPEIRAVKSDMTGTINLSGMSRAIMLLINCESPR